MLTACQYWARIYGSLLDSMYLILGELLDEKFAKLLKKLIATEPSNAKLIKAIFLNRLNEERADTACDNLHELTAVGWNYYEDFDGDSLTRLKFGYKKLIDYLSSQLPEKCVRLNEMVVKIDYTQGARVTVYNKKENTNKTYTADYVICTMSLGYLKMCQHELFEPKLPALKIKAIENLGFGCVNKLFIVFEKEVLQKKVAGLQILWRDDLEFKLESNTKWNLQVKA